MPELGFEGSSLLIGTLVVLLVLFVSYVVVLLVHSDATPAAEGFCARGCPSCAPLPGGRSYATLGEAPPPAIDCPGSRSGSCCGGRNGCPSCQEAPAAGGCVSCREPSPGGCAACAAPPPGCSGGCPPRGCRGGGCGSFFVPVVPRPRPPFSAGGWPPQYSSSS